MKTKEVGRLALREEGHLWAAYYAKPNTMNDALFLGSIQMSIVQDPKHKLAFMTLMRDAVGDIIEEIVGVRPVWPKPEGEPAPEHERKL